MSNFLSAKNQPSVDEYTPDLLTSINYALPLVFILCPSLAVIAPSCDSNTHIDHGVDILVEQSHGRQVLYFLSMNQDIARNGYELIEPLQPFCMGSNRIPRN